MRGRKNMGNYYNPVKIKIDSIDVIEDVLNI